MDNVITPSATNIGEQDRQLQETVRQERSHLLDFIRRRVPDRDEAEDLLQDVFYELTEAYRLTKPIERVASWLFAVARNKINDWYRRPAYARNTSLDAALNGTETDDNALLLSEFLPAAELSAPDSLMRDAVLEALAEALGELPPEQREVFVRHEIDGQSFRQMADELGVSINTLLSRKRYAVLYLRDELRDLYEEWIAP
ncbi:MAG: sigma-70 family RNA polymerase sigma factor [Cytophagaceae bacterium]|nr:sigma-70 family RNA polymerase sigma factor [Cytophagaceae bacterium]